MDSPATYLQWGFILISQPNLLVIVSMLVLFAIALILPFPHGNEGGVSRAGSARLDTLRGDSPLRKEGGDGRSS